MLLPLGKNTTPHFQMDWENWSRKLTGLPPCFQPESLLAHLPTVVMRSFASSELQVASIFNRWLRFLISWVPSHNISTAGHSSARHRATAQFTKIYLFSRYYHFIPSAVI